MIKNIIFDWSGVINDVIEKQLFIVNEMFQELGVREISLEELKETWEQPFMLFYNKYLPDLTLEEEKIVYQRIRSESKTSNPFKGIVDVLKKLKEKGIKMVVLTSDFPATVFPEIESFGLSGVFIDVNTDAHDKLNGAKELIKKHNFKNDETIFIGDSNHEIEVGKELGIKTGAVTWGFCTEEKLKTLNPDFMIHNIDELKEIIN